MLACLLIGLQLMRVYFRHRASKAILLTKGLQGLSKNDMEWQVECGERKTSRVEGCSPSQCARYGAPPPPLI